MLYNQTKYNQQFFSCIEKYQKSEDLCLYTGQAGLLYSILHVNKELYINDNLLEFASTVKNKLLSSEFPEDNSFSNGFTGIAWALSYLINNNLIDKNKLSILNNIDDEMYKITLYEKNESLALSNGLMGKVNYYLSRFYDNRRNQYRQVYNREVLKILTAKLTTKVSNILDEIDNNDSKIVDKLCSSELLFANLFQTLFALFKIDFGGIDVEKALIYLVRVFIRFIELVSDSFNSICESKKKGRLVFYSIVRCVVIFSQHSNFIKERVDVLVTRFDAYKDLHDIKYKNTQELLLKYSFVPVKNIYDDMNYIFSKEYSEYNGIGLNGLSGSFYALSLINKKKEIRTLTDCFLF